MVLHARHRDPRTLLKSTDLDCVFVKNTFNTDPGLEKANGLELSS